jgi:molecular chaperone DnaK
MRKDAEAHADEDRKRKELIEARNNADNTVYAAEKAVRDFGDKVPADTRGEIESRVAAVKQAAGSEDVAAIKSATEALGQSIQKIGAAVYQQPESGPAQGQPGGDPGQASGAPEGDVIDGEVKE